jgi:hypothetical protein
MAERFTLRVSENALCGTIPQDYGTVRPGCDDYCIACCFYESFKVKSWLIIA